MNAQEPSYQTNAAPTLPVEDEPGRFRIRPGMVVLGLGVLLVAIIVFAVVTNGDTEPGISNVTVAELRADPDGWDNRKVRMVGSAESIRELPILSQYAIYTFRDETGTMLALTRNGAPPDDSQRITIEAVFHSKVRLDDELNDIVSDQLGPLAGAAIETILPGIPLDVVYLGHESYEVLE